MCCPPSILLCHRGARKDSLKEIGCEIELEEALRFGLEQEIGWKNRGHIVLAANVH